MGEVSTLFVRKMLDNAPVADARAQLLERVGVTEAQLANPKVMVPARKSFALLENIADL